MYAFQLRAREILEDESGFGDEVTSNVTIVIVDVDDQIPTFNRDNFTVAVPEDVGKGTKNCRKCLKSELVWISGTLSLFGLQTVRISDTLTRYTLHVFLNGL